MKNIVTTLVLSSVLLFTSCQSDYLDLDPLDAQTEASYFKTPADFKAASNDFYNKMVSWRGVDGSNIYNFMDFGTDLTSLSQDEGRGNTIAPVSDIYWRNPYKYIRANNILLNAAAQYQGNKTDIAQYVAAAKFFRAWHHFFLLKRYGGVPVVTTVVDVNDGVLYGKRNSRYEVMNQIITDLNEAIPDLPLEQNIAASDKGHLSKWAAKAFKARVLLYEATWEKYVGTTTDGDGVSNGAGTTGNASNTQAYLEEVIELTKDVMSNGGYELWNHNAELNNFSMYYLFNLEDAGSNPAGLDKSTNKEFILYNKYDFSLLTGNTNLSHTVGSRLAPSRKFMDMFLCSDGLPVDKSPLFQGYVKVGDEYRNRDYRLTSYFVDLATDAIPVSGAIKLFGPGGDSGSGYANRKFRAYNYGTYRAANTESADYPQIRLAEVYLMYAEALYELNGTITDGQLNESINLIRQRAGLPALTNTFVTTNNLNMLDEIRRERAVELFGENTRYDDLKRWGVAEQILNEPILGSVIQATDYEGNINLYKPTAYPYGELSVATGKGNLKALLLDPTDNRNFQRKHYLFPLPTSQLQMNTKLLQNPGY
ncbi:RagB/SusD family nutrient uptake outer membrane protein [Flavobacterium cheongpyeongense]|uniref:RagB/SusD family nutrient uptake outer membrane protein n=1 Tax=Flavobacterium cheongpyeongense TaxID=2212651 RepID=A0A2V4BMJ4_9FLAO|nr:RagB/SusD family nutrient uptake outer membrane protein [Flavobacterium cheongpyeongense]PXY39213.1 RagB/SusD family nutrient uptake outer membrane protein [Flavobacterium cheongpyeongense]